MHGTWRIDSCRLGRLRRGDWKFPATSVDLWWISRCTRGCMHVTTRRRCTSDRTDRFLALGQAWTIVLADVKSTYGSRHSLRPCAGIQGVRQRDLSPKSRIQTVTQARVREHPKSRPRARAFFTLRSGSTCLMVYNFPRLRILKCHIRDGDLSQLSGRLVTFVSCVLVSKMLAVL